MRDATTNKYKIQIVLYIKELFKTFPQLMCLDFHIKNNITTDLITSQHNDNFFIFFNSFLDLDHYQELQAFNSGGKILGIEEVEINEQTKRIFNWELIHTAMEIHEENINIDIKDNYNNSYNYSIFHKKYLNFDILKNESFIEEIYQQYQYKNPQEINYYHRFARDNEQGYIDFLGPDTYALYEKQTLNQNAQIPNSNPLSLEVFKI